MFYKKIVTRYLRRDRRVAHGIADLVQLADSGRQALALGNIDELASVINATWAIHQDMDPHCSNPAVDALLAQVADYTVGWKLAGAGGGGFAGLIAKDAAAAQRIAHHFIDHQSGAQVYPWTLAL